MKKPTSSCGHFGKGVWELGIRMGGGIDSKLKFPLLLFTGYFNLSDESEIVRSSEKINGDSLK